MNETLNEQPAGYRATISSPGGVHPGSGQGSIEMTITGVCSPLDARRLGTHAVVNGLAREILDKFSG